MPGPKLRFAYFLKEFPQGDYMPPGAGTQKWIMEVDRSVTPTEIPCVLLAVAFDGAYDRHRAKCTFCDPRGDIVWEDSVRTRKNVDPTWSALFQIEFWPRHPGLHRASVFVDGELFCERFVEVVFIDSPRIN